MATKTLTEPAIVGVFAQRSDAQRAISALRQAGFGENEIGMVTQNKEGTKVTTHDGDDNNAAEGAAVGAATGIGVGALWALGIAAGVLPAIGPAIAGGLFASILTSAVGGAAVGGLIRLCRCSMTRSLRASRARMCLPSGWVAIHICLG